ncbi:MAG: FtsH protease activity modulator HflK [Acidobacteriota bacterium]
MADVKTFRTVRGQFPPEWRPYLAMLPSALLIVAVVAAVFTSFFTVASDEEAVIRRFGRYVRTTRSGLHWKLPFGVESATKVRVEYIHTAEFGFTESPVRTRRGRPRGRAESETPQMLTGDLNVADVDWIVQYKIRDPKAYLFRVQDVDQTLRNVSEAVMRRIVGDRSVTEVLTVGRAEIALLAEQEMQDLLDRYETGLQIITVQLKDVNPPGPVKPSFNEVNEARQEKERITNQAWEAYNKAIPEAEGAALRTVSKAGGYAINRVNRAKGDAERFLAVLREYRRAPEVTRKRLYLEAMADVLPQIDQKYVVDERMRGILPLLDLGVSPAPKVRDEGKP